jgi:hypothetical protein
MKTKREKEKKGKRERESQTERQTERERERAIYFDSHSFCIDNRFLTSAPEFRYRKSTD